MVSKEIIDGLEERFPNFVKDMERIIRCDWTQTPYIHLGYQVLWNLVLRAERNKQTLLEPVYYFGDYFAPIFEWEIGEEKLVVNCENGSVRLSLYEKISDDDAWITKSHLVKKFFSWE
jgi:hypothetical protein